MKKLIGLSVFLLSLKTFAQLPTVASGVIRRFENFHSQYVQPRNVDVWLPADYDSLKKYSVLYMHDGQMLFDSAITWNKQEWKVDETITSLKQQDKIKDVIVVGIRNNGAYRHAEYFPEKALAYLPAEIREKLIEEELMSKPQANNYLLFIVKELKPFIDKTFSTHMVPNQTFIAGSSMGGLISLYAICKYPTVFGGAACLSTHWPGSLKQHTDIIPKAFEKYFSKHLPSPKEHRLYFDYGDKTLDSAYRPYQLMIDKIANKKGYNYSSGNWMSKEFKGANHSEKSWSQRLDIPLKFLLAK